MKTARELTTLLYAVDTPARVDGMMALIRELALGEIARREADEKRAVAVEAEALRARVLAECHIDRWTHGGPEDGAVTLTHVPTGLSAAAPRRDTALDALIGQLRGAGAL